MKNVYWSKVGGTTPDSKQTPEERIGDYEAFFLAEALFIQVLE
ncbi:MAG: hypothetical protein AAGD07_22385 [Planctomycetota bacterium]